MFNVQLNCSNLYMFTSVMYLRAERFPVQIHNSDCIVFRSGAKLELWISFSINKYIQKYRPSVCGEVHRIVALFFAVLL